jgi:hypothetical protein
MIKKIRYFVVTLLSLATMTSYSQTINEDLALKLSRMPLSCIPQEFPNKTSHLSDGVADHKLTPSELHPVFYGCLDWHSSVHGHWLLVKILKLYPNIANRDSIVGLLNSSFQIEKIKEEASYFQKYTSSSSYERTYGWAWLLKLDQELKMWDNPQAQEWHKNLQPLTKMIVNLWMDYLPKQTYPNRTGVHPNTAFGLAFALDWARAVSDTAFEKLIVEKAKNFYADNENVPAYFEPDGSDFFSPSLEVADLMRRVYDSKRFTRWFKNYYHKRGLERIMQLPVVSDRKDYQIVHLDGLAFSRAWCMKGIASHLNSQPALAKRLKDKADLFISSTLPNISHDNYGGSHWLASFAFYALQ